VKQRGYFASHRFDSEFDHLSKSKFVFYRTLLALSYLSILLIGVIIAMKKQSNRLERFLEQLLVLILTLNVDFDPGVKSLDSLCRLFGE
jgi:hypothetical protein